MSFLCEFMGTTFLWDSELEYLAGLNILGCELKHDQCHNTWGYRWSGQNLAIYHKTSPILPSEYIEIVVDLITEWFNEHENANQDDLDMCSESAKHNNMYMVKR